MIGRCRLFVSGGAACHSRDAGGAVVNRRAFVAVLAQGTVAAARVVHAQSSARMARLGFLGAESASSYASNLEALRAGLQDLGYTEGSNLVIEYRWAEGRYERLPALAAELVRLNVAAIVTHGTPGARAVQAATTTVPIIVATVGDPVAGGLVTSLAHPGGNLTGSITLTPDLMVKRLELLREAMPRVARVGVLVNPDNPARVWDLGRMEMMAGSWKIGMEAFEVRGVEELGEAFAAMGKRRMQAVVVYQDGKLNAQLKAIADLATRHRLPSSGVTEFAEAGGLIGYGVNFLEMYRRAAYFVDRVLRGAQPGDLPLEQASKFQLSLNLRTAKALGLTLPRSLVARADELIR